MNWPDAKLVGLISDTHGLLRPEALLTLHGCDLILHAGDVGNPEILDGLRALAPVIAVRGNVDTGEWASHLPAIARLEAGPASIYMLHDLNQLDLDPAAAGIRVVVSGHSHKPLQRRQDGVLYINPGAAGPRRFNLPITVARLNLHAAPLQTEYIDLIAGSN